MFAVNLVKHHMARISKTIRSGKKLDFSGKEVNSSKLQKGLNSVDSMSMTKNTKELTILNPIQEDEAEFILPQSKLVEDSIFKKKSSLRHSMSVDESNDLIYTNREPQVIILPQQSPLENNDISDSLLNFDHKSSIIPEPNHRELSFNDANIQMDQPQTDKLKDNLA